MTHQVYAQENWVVEVAWGGSQMDGVRGWVCIPFLHWMPVGLDAQYGGQN